LPPYTLFMVISGKWDLSVVLVETLWSFYVFLRSYLKWAIFLTCRDHCPQTKPRCMLSLHAQNISSITRSVYHPLRAIPLATHCDDTSSNELCSIVDQGMLALREVQPDATRDLQPFGVATDAEPQQEWDFGLKPANTIPWTLSAAHKDLSVRP